MTVSSASEATAPIPLVIVEGFLCNAGPRLWGPFEKYSNGDLKDEERPPRRIIFASVGPVSSLHDRACELYYTLRGGTVDYGLRHAGENRHGRYGRSHAGLYPEWSREKPLHFLGHSMGGATIVKLQWLLSTGFFGRDGHPDMCLSITTISAPFRGTQAVYTLGERTDSAPAVRPFSLGNFVSKIVHVTSYLSPLLPVIIDLHAESRSLAFTQSSFASFLRQLWHSEWAEGRDAGPYDVTFEAADRREAQSEGAVHPNTYYRSYTACMTQRRAEGQGWHMPQTDNFFFVPALYALSTVMGTFDFSAIRPIPNCIKYGEPRLGDPESANYAGSATVMGENQETLWANDGIVPLFSQWHPLDCRSTRCKHKQNGFETEYPPVPPEPGIWHVHYLERATHTTLAPAWYGTARQQAFWKDYGRWMQTIDSSVMSWAIPLDAVRPRHGMQEPPSARTSI